MPARKIASRADWLIARREHLANEKALTRALDELREERRRLPWVRVDKPYAFEGADGPVSLDDLFDGRSQLVVQHFMFAPDWEEGCMGCSFQADHVDAAWLHLAHHDVSFAAISRAPFPMLEAYRRRMGWRFRWVSSHGSDFNFDFGVSFAPDQIAAGVAAYNFGQSVPDMEELPGVSVFVREGGEVFHTYSSFARGPELLIGAYNYLDLTPFGRNETGARRNLADWVRRHDSYEAKAGASCCCAAGREAA